MKNKKFIAIAGILLVFIVTISIFLLLKKDEKIYVSKEYFVKFVGGSGEITYQTYVYETDSKTKKYKYVLTTSETQYWGSTEREENTNKEGFARSIEEVVELAKEHNCGSAIYHEKTYSLEEFLKVFEKE